MYIHHHCITRRMLLLLAVAVISAVCCQESPILLASKDFLNDVIAQVCSLTMYVLIYKILRII